jgi:MFS family permease
VADSLSAVTHLLPRDLSLRYVRIGIEEVVVGIGEQKPSDWRELALEDFKARRASVIALLQATQTALTFGATTVGILIAGSLNVWEERLLASLAFLVAIPLVCVIVLVNWAGLVIALMQLGAYNARLERTLRESYENVPDSVMSWEAHWAARFLVKRPNKKWWIPDIRWAAGAAPVIFVLLAAGSIVLGAYRGFAGNEVAILVIAVLEGLVLVLVSILLARELTTGHERFRPPSSSRC